MKFYKIFILFIFSSFSIVIAQDDDDFEFEDDDFEFEDEEFDLDELDDFDLEDDDFDELLEEFEIEEEEGFEEGEPRKFSIGLSTGMLLPFGANLKERFNSGLNIGLNIKTPFGFYFGPFEVIFGGEISYSSLAAIESDCSNRNTGSCYFNPNSIPYNIFNIVGTAQTKILFLNVTGGIAYTTASANLITQSNGGTYGDEVEKAGLAIIVDAEYPIPINMGPINMGLMFRAQEILATPGGIPGETSDLIGLGIKLNYIF